MTTIPTWRLRWFEHYDDRREHDISVPGPNKHSVSTLQQCFIDADTGKEIWQDVPVDYESNRT
jgi:hypothetical protein